MAAENSVMKSVRGLATTLLPVAAGLAAIYLALFYGRPFPITSDILYIAEIKDAGILHYRFPPSSYLLPDYLYYRMSGFLSSDILERVFISGILQFLVFSVLALRRFGAMGWMAITLVYLALFRGSGIVFIVYHFNVLTLVLLYLTVPRRYRWLAVLVGGTFEPLFLVPVMVGASVLRLLKAGGGRPQAAAALAAMICAFLLVGGSSALFELGVGLGAGWMACGVVDRIGLARRGFASISSWASSRGLEPSWAVAALSLAALTVLGGAAGEPYRYCATLMASSVLFALEALRPRALPVWATGSTILVLIGLLAGLGLPRLMAQQVSYEEQYRCLADRLAERGIDAVATDYSTSKPLRLLARYGGAVVPIDFRLGRPYMRIRPEILPETTVRYVVRANLQCHDADFQCLINYASAWVEKRATETPPVPLCGQYMLYHLDQPITYEVSQSKGEAMLNRLRMVTLSPGTLPERCLDHPDLCGGK